LGEQFFKYKQDVNSLKDTVEKHFSKVISQIEAGLPDVIDNDENDHDIFIPTLANWLCPTCTTEN
jgi:hypothetical protein